jgi:hypothetical protein
MIPLVVHELLCLYLVYSVFVRAVPMTCDTKPAVRLVFWLVAVVALLGVAAPVLWPWMPDLFALALELVFALVQGVTNHYWQGRVPDAFCRPGCAPRNRRSTDPRSQS